MVEIALQLIKEKAFEEVEEPKESLLDWAMFSKYALECYKLMKINRMMSSF